MIIPDPIELGEARMERAMDRIDGDDYECYCGKTVKLEDCIPASGDPYAPPVCPDCAEDIYGSRS